MMAATFWGQTLEMPPVVVDRGSANIFRIVFNPRADKPVAALQWELIAPGSLKIEAAGIVSSSGVDTSGKSITCSNRVVPKDGEVSLCILAGGTQPIPGGAIAIVKFTAAADAKPGPAIVRLQKIQGVSLDLNKVAIADTSATMTIR
jgi:hypothetical protein